MKTTSMSQKMMLATVKFAAGLVIAVTCTSSSFAAQTIEQQTMDRLDQLRAIKADEGQAAFDKFSQAMDANWKFFSANKVDVLPVLQRELALEAARARPNDLLLLDVGFFVYGSADSAGKSVAKEALYRINPGAPTITANWKEYFGFVQRAAEDHDQGILKIIDRDFLPSDRKIDVPQHALVLDGTLICVFLYGVYGEGAEAELRSMLKDKARSIRVLEILGWLGSPDSLQAVAGALTASSDYQTLLRVTNFMMQDGGPAGRDFMLSLTPSKFDAQSQQYLSKIDGAVKKVSFEYYEKSFESLPGDRKLSDGEVKARLAAMLANFGKDDRTSPLSILNSGLPSPYLLGELAKIRTQMLFRLSDEALSDVEATNALMNGLRYREK